SLVAEAPLIMSVPVNPDPGALDNLRQAGQNDHQAADAAGQQQEDPNAVVQQQQVAQNAAGQQAAPNAVPNAVQDDQQLANETVRLCCFSYEINFMFSPGFEPATLGLYAKRSQAR
ncbi:hypothetical protein AC249_AIPGENE8051, partial [Exaiptasia diaphana]